MNYKEILTEEAAEQFRKEGSTHVVIGIYGDADLIRTIEVRLDKGIFHIAGKTVQAAAAMEAHFVGKEVDGRMWYPFHLLLMRVNSAPEKALTIVAKAAEADPIELEWSFINER